MEENGELRVKPTGLSQIYGYTHTHTHTQNAYTHVCIGIECVTKVTPWINWREWIIKSKFKPATTYEGELLMDLNMKGNMNIKLIKENAGEHFCDPGARKDFVNKFSKA